MAGRGPGAHEPSSSTYPCSALLYLGEERTHLTQGSQKGSQSLHNPWPGPGSEKQWLLLLSLLIQKVFYSNSTTSGPVQAGVQRTLN